MQIWQLALILALSRVCVTFEMPSRQVLLLDLVGRGSLMNAIALNSGLFNASRVIGPALAGLCLARFGRTACFALNGASYLAAIAALLSIRAKHRPEVEIPAHHDHLLGGLAYVRANRRVATLFGLMMFFGVVGMGYAAMLPAYARLVLRTQTVGYSVLVASGGLGATVGALVIASLGGLARKERLVTAGMLVFSASLAAAGSLPTFAPAIVGPPGRLRLPRGDGLRRDRLLRGDADPHPDGRARRPPRPGDGHLDDRLFRLGPAGRDGGGRGRLAMGVGHVMLASAMACGLLALLIAASGRLRDADQAPPARSINTEA